jgi:hypothetical protein
MSRRNRNQRSIFSAAHDLWDLTALFHTHKIRPATPIARYLNITLIGLLAPVPHLNSVAILVEVEDFDNSLVNPLHECG